jgi:hypothetical protein
MTTETKKNVYGCSDYRREMTLLGLRKRLNDAGLSTEERQALTEEIRRLESETGLDEA